MAGVLVIAAGVPAALEHGEFGAVALGYVIMRLGLVAQWLRVAADDAASRGLALRSAIGITIAQAAWVLWLGIPEAGSLPFFAALVAFELAIPRWAERRRASSWHPHHIAERYGLLMIITLGEGILGTIAAVSALVSHVQWSAEAVLVTVAGVGITFGLWWNYFIVPSAEVLERHRGRAWVWGYGHIPLFAATAAVGAGIHVAAYVVEGEATIGVVGAVLATAIPVGIATLVYFALYSSLIRGFDPFHVALFVGTLAVLAAAVVLAATGLSLGWSLIVVTLAPVVTIVGFEARGHRHMAAALDRILA
jgi:low temperature requirement protein LtrA